MMECNKNCFHCSYSDCVYEGLDTSDIDTSIVDSYIVALKSSQDKDYKYRHKPSIIARKLEYNREYRQTEKYKEKRKEYDRKYRNSDKYKYFLSIHPEYVEKKKQYISEYQKNMRINREKSGCCKTCGSILDNTKYKNCDACREKERQRYLRRTSQLQPT